MTTTLTLQDVIAELLNAQAPLAESLNAYAGKLREMNPSMALAYDELIARLERGAIGAAAPAVGDVWPEFMLPDQVGKLASVNRR